MIAYMHEEDEEVASLLPAKAFEITATSNHHQMIELLFFFSPDTKFVRI
jgi:hypothetical protein